MFKSLVAEIPNLEHKSQRLSKILEEYRASAEKQERYEEFVIDLVKRIEKFGMTNHVVAIAVDKMVQETGMKRGMFKDFIVLYHSEEITPQELNNINNFVRVKKSIAMTLEEFKGAEKKYCKQIDCLAFFDEMWKGKKSRIAEIYNHMWNQHKDGVTLAVFKRGLEEMNMEFDKASFERFCRGRYLKYGWIMLSENAKNGVLYKLHPVRWDGDHVPEGAVDYASYQKYK